MKLCDKKNVRRSWEYKTVLYDVARITASVQKTSFAELENETKILKDKRQSAENVKNFRFKIRNHLSKLKGDTLGDFCIVQTSMRQIAEQAVEQLEKNKTLLQGKIESLLLNDNGDDDVLFIEMVETKKKFSKQVKNFGEMIKHLGTIQFSINPVISSQIDSHTVLGNFETVPKVNTWVHGDRSACNITDMCQLEDGSFLLCDSRNLKLKKLNMNYVIVASLEIASSPAKNLHVCETDCEAAVLIEQNQNKSIIWFVSKDLTKVLRSVQVQGSCHSLAYHNRALFVCCGGDKSAGDTLNVYSPRGSLSRVIHGSLSCQLRFSSLKSVTSSGDFLYVADERLGIIEVDPDRNSFRAIHMTHFLLPASCRMCLDDKKYVYFRSGESSRVFRVSVVDGSVTDVNLHMGSIGTANALCFDRKKNRLIVAFDELNELYVFTVSY